MRTVRWMSGLALLALLPAVGQAQSSRYFQNSWFWGFKVADMNTNTGVTTFNAPLVGLEWLITRTHAGLYVTAEEAFFSEPGGVFDNAGNFYNLTLKDMTKFSFAALAFPYTFGTLRPYVGLGLAINNIQHVNVNGTITDPDQAQVVADRLAELRSTASFLLMGGGQWALKRASVFGQVQWMPARGNFLFSGRATWFLETGIRYNFGESRDSEK